MGRTAPLITDEELAADVAALAVESMGWVPLSDAAYLHVGNQEALVIKVVGVPEVGMAGMNVLLVG